VAEAELEVVRAIHAAWAKRESPRELIAKDIEYVNPPYAVESGTRRDRKALGAVLEVFPDFSLEPERFVDAGDEVLVLATASGTGASGVKMVWKQGFLWKVENGRATRLRWFNDWDEALEAAGLDA
jgi:ketosteroid isomerase-like protein